MENEKKIMHNLESGLQQAKEITAKKDSVIKMIQANITKINKEDMKISTRENILKQLRGEI